MQHLIPAVVGSKLEDISTPALLVDLDAYERNLSAMAKRIAAHDVRLRPHAKTHKSPVVARQQMAHGAVGSCCQTVSEAEALVDGGIDNVLVSNQVVGKAKIARLAGLAKRARLGVCVDNVQNIADLSAAAHTAGSKLNVLVEVDVGMGRCGVAPGKPALALAVEVEQAPALHFEGIQAYHGAAQHIRDHEERRLAVDRAIRAARETVTLLSSEGIACETVAGAGTGTFEFEAASGVYNELQAGSYIFMDADYVKNKKANGDTIDTFEHSLFVLATVVSVPASDRAVLDVGLKSTSAESGLPVVWGVEGVSYTSASDEHGALDLSQSNHRYKVGDVVKLVPGHCDPTVNLHDWYVGIRGDRVESVWPVAARGPGV